MSKNVVPVAKSVAALTVGGLLLYTILHSASAQQPNPAAANIDTVVTDTAGLPGPVQPIFYRHDIHAGIYQMDCRYCHYASEVSQSPGLPSVADCMGCHLIAGGANPEVAKLRQFANDSTPIPWVEVHQIAPFVHFPHSRHVNSGVTCQECHGPIETMPQVYQFASLKMGWCLTCHEQRNVTTDCTACHY